MKALKAQEADNVTPETCYRVGLAITDTAIALCVLDKHYALLQHVKINLPEGIVHLQKGVMDANGLETIIKTALTHCSLAPEDYTTCESNLAIMPPFLGIQHIEPTKEPEDIHHLLSEAIRATTKRISEKRPLIYYEWLANTVIEDEKHDVYITASIEKMALRSYIRVIKQIGLHLNRIEPLPNAELRGLAGSGTLDTTFQSMNKPLSWAYIALYEESLILTIWQNRKLELLQSFEHPKNQGELEKTLKEAIAYSGLTPPALCFANQSNAAQTSTLNIYQMPGLNIPVSVATAGPFFSNNAGQTPDIGALGAAIGQAVDFPFDWDFLRLAPDESAIWAVQY